jgi:D-serine dehydratase
VNLSEDEGKRIILQYGRVSRALHAQYALNDSIVESICGNLIVYMVCGGGGARRLGRRGSADGGNMLSSEDINTAERNIRSHGRHEGGRETANGKRGAMDALE